MNITDSFGHRQDSFKQIGDLFFDFFFSLKTHFFPDLFWRIFFHKKLVKHKGFLKQELQQSKFSL
jgi:hypothetical protein